MAESDVDTESVGGQPPEEEIFTDPNNFLKAIHFRFLQTVYPFDSYLVDDLRARSVFDSDDEDNIRAEKSRRDQARRCWSLLCQVPASRFHLCLPALKDCCASVVAGRTFRWDGRGEDCLRHLIQKSMSLRRFADTFPGAHGCSREEYRMMTEGSDSSATVTAAMWDKAFELCCHNKDSGGFLAMLETTLRTAGIPVPDDLGVMLGQGLRCSCPDPAALAAAASSKGQKRKGSKKRKKRSRKRSRKFHEARDSNSDQRSLAASTREAIPPPQIPPLVPAARNQGCAPEGPQAVHTLYGSEDGVRIPKGEQSVDETAEQEEEEQDCPFESEEKKESYLKRLGELNKAITQASSIKALYHEASGLQLELQALAHPTQAELTASRRLEERGKAHRLGVQVKDVQDRLEKAYEEASKTREASGKITATGGSRAWDQHEKTLQARQELLASELTQAEVFYRQALETFRLLNRGQGSQEPPQERAAEAEAEDALLLGKVQGIEVSLDTVNKRIAEQDDHPDFEDFGDELEWTSGANSPVGDEEGEEAEEDFCENDSLYEVLYDFSDEETDDNNRVSDSRETIENDDIFYEAEQHFDEGGADDVFDGYDSNSCDNYATLGGFGSDDFVEEDFYYDGDDEGF